MEGGEEAGKAQLSVHVRLHGFEAQRSERAGWVIGEGKSEREGFAARGLVLEQPRAPLLAAAKNRAGRRGEQRGLDGVRYKLLVAGVREKVPDRLLTRDEDLLDAARVNRCLKKGRARCWKAGQEIFERARFPVDGGVDNGVLLGWRKFAEHAAEQEAQLSHASRGAARKSIAQAIARGGDLLDAGRVGANGVDVTFKHG